MTDSTLNPEIPAASRIYDYLSGGSFHFPADRGAADFMVSLVPSVPKWLEMLRAYLQKAAVKLSNEGLTHFVDFGSGLPSDSHIHAILPNAKVIYVDIDPYVVAEGKRMLANYPNALYLQGDVREASNVLALQEISEFLGNIRRVAFGLSGLSVFFAPSELTEIMRGLYDWADAGSKIYTNYETKNPALMTEKMSQFVGILTQAGGDYRFYTVEESREVGNPWQLSKDGLIPLAQFLELPSDYIIEADREGVDLEFYAAILEK